MARFRLGGLHDQISGLHDLKSSARESPRNKWKGDTSHTSDAGVPITDIDFCSLSLICDLIQGAQKVSDALEPPGS